MNKHNFKYFYLLISIIITIEGLVVILLCINLVSATPKWEICNAINLTGSSCDVWWDNSNLSQYFTVNATYNLTIEYHSHTTEQEFRNYTYYNCSCNLSSANLSDDIYTKSQIDTTFLTKSDFESKKFTGNLGDYAKKSEINSLVNQSLNQTGIYENMGDFSLSWKIAVIIIGVIAGMAIVLVQFKGGE